jgi:RHS repeat-associated protein
VFTSSATIAATNAAYDGQNIIVSNCSVVIDGQHSFANVQAISNAVLSYAAATNVNVQGMTVDGSSALYLCGGLAFNVGGTLVATNNSTVICQGTNTIAQVSNQWAGVGVTITAGNVSLAAGAAISADGQGYASGNGGGAGPGGGEGGAGAGSYGGLGSGPSGPTYGNAMAPLDLGSAGWVGSQGGGAIKLVVSGNLVVNGSISANGAGGPDGASGGSIYIITGGLMGGGTVEANGNSRNCNGGGGRVAVYYDDASQFASFTNVTANAGGSGAQDGSVVFVDRRVTSGIAIQVYQRLAFASNSAVEFASLTLAPSATVVLGGGSALQVDGLLTVSSNATIICEGANVSGQASNQWAGVGVTITASNMNVAAGGAISADGQGYASGNGGGPGGGEGPAGAGSYGGLGSGPSGPTYGNAMAPLDLGSAGWVGSQGGGAIKLVVAGNLVLNGGISANGAGGPDGASGGSIYIMTGGLMGGGTIAANGNSRNCNGGGGRVAVNYDDASGFASFSNVTANAGGSGAQDGSVVFVDRTVTSGIAIQVYQRLAFAPESAPEFASLTLAPNATVVLGGGSALQVDGLLTVSSNATLLCEGQNLSEQVSNQWAGVGVTITASNVTVAAGAAIDADGQGYSSAAVNGAGPGGGKGAFGAGSYGGLGSGPSGPTYGNALAPVDLGSGGWVGSQGGGAIKLVVSGNLEVNGRISANGAGSPDGASGGSIYIITGGLLGGGTISANGNSANCQGGGGRVAVYYDDASGFASFTNVTANAGGSGAQDGSVVFVDRTVANGVAIQVYQRLAFTTNSATEFASLTLAPNATVVLGGGSALQVDGLLTVSSNATILCEGENVSGQVSNQWAGLGVTITSSNMNVAAGGAISADGQGYASGIGAGAGPGGGQGTAGAGSYGGLGSGPSGPIYGNALAPVDLGSGGWVGSQGGGAIKLVVAGNLVLDGSISANGEGGPDGASGGSVYIITGGLMGGGTISADGNSANCEGGGGRVAVYYDDASGFARFTNVTANAGGSAAQDGSVVFVDRTVTSGVAAQVYQRLTYAANSTPEFASLWLAPNATLALGGDSALEVDGSLMLSSNSTILCEGENVTGQVSGRWAGVGVTLTAGSATVPAGAAIRADGQGYASTEVNGAGPGGGKGGFGGGSYGGQGSGSSGPTYGDATAPMDLGSGGWVGSQGGGAIKLVVASNLVLNGSISANAEGGPDGASGGSVFIIAGGMMGSGSVSADGNSANCNGGGGRIAIYYLQSFGFPTNQIAANAGGAGAQNGTIIISTQTAEWPPSASDALHGTESISWQALAAGVPGASVIVTANAGGTSYPLGTTSNGKGGVNWNTTSVPNGVYQLVASFTAPSGQNMGEISRTVFVNNSLAWHAGTLSANQTWGTNTVNGVDQNVIIPSGVTLTLAPGAIVKFAKGTGIIIQPGGILDASGATAGEPIILTSFADDSAGGDSNEDGDNSVPMVGDWNGLTDSGQFKTSTYVQIRYVIQTESGTLSQNQEWLGGVEYLINGNLTIPSGVTLTIDPGAIVKFDLGLKLSVESGGTLIASGTVAQPIVFTSINDASAGADTNAVLSSPAAGDWDSIYLDGGQAAFDHVAIGYGGGPDPLNSGLISIIGQGSVVTIADSTLSQGLYRGIQAEYGTANVTNCVVTGCDRGIQAGLNGPTVVNIVNCTLDGNNIGLFAHGGTMNVANTIVADSLETGVEYCCGSSLTTFEYCDVWSANGANYAGISDQTGLNGNISANPKFVNAAQGNYELNYRSPCIDAAGGAVAPPTDLTGAPRYNDPRTPVKAGIPNASGLYPDIGAFEFVETASSTVDLIANSVTGPTEETAGQTVAVQWNDVNIGTGNAMGPWHDTVSLVPQNGGDTLAVATVLVARSVVLGPGQSYPASASVVVPGGQDGPYQWQVEVNSQGDVFEGANWTNNTSLADAPTVLTVPLLSLNGTAITNLSSTANSSLAFSFLPQPRQDIQLSLNLLSGGGGVDVYIGQGYMPTPEHFDIHQTQLNWSTLSALIPSASTEPYYILVVPARLGNTPDQFTVAATALSFQLTGVSPASVGNGGPSTLQIQGSQLTAAMACQVVDPSGTPHNPISVTALNNSQVSATFDFTGMPVGNYSVQIAGTSAVLPGALKVTRTPPGSLALRITGPALQRPGSSSTLIVSYSNTGGSDLASPILFLESDNGQFRLPGDPLWVPGQYQILAINTQGGPAGVLPPGYNGQIQIEFSQQTLQANGTSDYTVSMADPSTNVDWAGLEQTVEPRFEPDDAWAVIFTNFLAKVGTTYGQFQSVLAQDATYLGQQGELVADVRRLLAFEFEQADNFGVITKRYYLGAFGRGAADPTDVSAFGDGSGNVVVQSSGLIRFFALQPDGSYLGQPGDYATLTQVNGRFQLRELDGVVTAFGPAGQLDYIEDSVNRITANYTGASLTSFSDSFGNTTAFSYNGNGRIAQVVDPVGRVTTFSYDAPGEHLASITGPTGTTSFTWLTNQGAATQHALSSIAFPDGTHCYYQYDAFGRMTSRSLDGGAEPISYAYDSAGGLTSTDAAGRTANVRLNEFFQRYRIQDPDGRLTSVNYDTNHQPIGIQATGGANWTLANDALGNPVALVNPLGQQTAVGYEPAYHQVASVIDGLGHRVSRTYDGSRNMVAETYPDGSAHNFQYDAAGNVTAWTNRRGLTTHFAYDAHNLLTNKTLSDGSTQTFGYDAHRNLATITDATGTTTYAYDSADRMTNVTYPNGRFLQFTYNAGGQRTQMRDQDGFTMNYSYDSLGRPAVLSDGSGSLIVRYAYDNIGRLTRKDFGNGSATTQAYTSAGLLQSITNRAADGSIVSSFGCSYDSLGRVTNMATLAGSFAYAYDANDQLTSVITPSGRAITYQYDGAGNRISTMDSGTNTVSIVSALNQYLTIGNVSFTYDMDGNLTSRTDASGTTTCAYDGQNRLVSLTSRAGAWTYQYNALGQRTGAALNGQQTQYVLDPAGLGSVVAEYNGSLAVHYTYGLDLTSRVDANGDAAYYAFDGSGNTANLIGVSSNVLASYTYLPFGEKLVANAAVPNPFTYVGQLGVMDGGEGVYFMRHRWYDPAEGHFTQPDPADLAGRSINLYEYAANNPVHGSDASGLGGELRDFGNWLLDLVTGLPASEGIQTAGQATSTGDANRNVQQQDYSLPNADTSVVNNTSEGGQFLPALQGTAHLTMSGATSAAGSGIGATENSPDATSPLGIANTAIGTAEGQMVPSAPDDSPWGPRATGRMIPGIDPYLPPGSGSRAGNWNPSSGGGGKGIPPGNGGPRGKGHGAGVPGGGKGPAKGKTKYPASTDPNDKVTSGFGTQGFVTDTGSIFYTVNFANETNAAAPAAQVVVTDQLDTNLNWSTFTFQTIAFNNVVITAPNGLHSFTTTAHVTTDPNPVQVSAAFNPATGVVKWLMESVDPITQAIPEDPLAGFLPPDNARGQGEGYVTYSVETKAGLAGGTQITNQAIVVFDVNAPILTPTVTNTIDAAPPASAITPLPATSQPSFTVSWSGADPWSGIASFDIYASTNGGAWGLWLLGTTNTSATFTGVSGDTYAFYSVAIDEVGNLETAPAIPGAQTAVGGVVQGPLLSHPMVSDGRFQFTLNITSTNSFVVQASADLKSWVPLLTNQPPFTFVDTNSAQSGRRFYRTQKLP